MTYKVYNNPPPDFSPKCHTAGCYCECEGKVLFLRRHPDKSQGSTWGVPGGKMEEGETPIEAVIREVYEEVGIPLAKPDIEEIGKLYIRLPEIDYIFYLFRKPFDHFPKINLGLEEHDTFTWATTEEIMKLPLIHGGMEALQYYMGQLDTNNH